MPTQALLRASLGHFHGLVFIEHGLKSTLFWSCDSPCACFHACGASLDPVNLSGLRLAQIQATLWFAMLCCASARSFSTLDWAATAWRGGKNHLNAVPVDSVRSAIGAVALTAIAASEPAAALAHGPITGRVDFSFAA
ncbi:uncharacterized protein MEPE_03147 [Melanopsichium pennsylvanicum]|uniref:Uncharacterized protein n=1 Tax=Melanopsichium pennsylvanicum TaxID=63383 RepID=A0AAJ4XLP0_9BASI|nr:uncharacterized protein MEPE_03147 [Melanopsichium pennsylvanicum]